MQSERMGRHEEVVHAPLDTRDDLCTLYAQQGIHCSTRGARCTDARLYTLRRKIGTRTTGALELLHGWTRLWYHIEDIGEITRMSKWGSD